MSAAAEDALTVSFPVDGNTPVGTGNQVDSGDIP